MSTIPYRIVMHVTFNYEEQPDGSSVNLGGGIFITAAHVFYRYMSENGDWELLNFNKNVSSALLYDGSIPQTINSIHISPAYDPTFTKDGPAPTVSHNDLAYFITSQPASSSSLNPIYAFADADAAKAFFDQNRAVDVNGINTATSGVTTGWTADGQFTASLAAQTEDGDSGGAATYNANGQSHLSAISGPSRLAYGSRVRLNPRRSDRRLACDARFCKATARTCNDPDGTTIARVGEGREAECRERTHAEARELAVVCGRRDGSRRGRCRRSGDGRFRQPWGVAGPALSFAEVAGSLPPLGGGVPGAVVRVALAHNQCPNRRCFDGRSIRRFLSCRPNQLA